MKKILLVSFFLFTAVFNTALSNDYGVSRLNITLFDDSEFSASLDGNEFGKSSTYAEIDELAEGKYFLKIVREDGAWASKSNIIYSDYIFIPAGYSLFAVIDDRGNFTIYKKGKYDSFSTHKKWHNPDKCNCNCEYCRMCLYKTHDPQIGQMDDCKFKSMKDRDFNDLVATIKKLTFESSQLDVLKQAIDMNVFTTSQVKQLLKLLTFEDSKVEIAKYAYKNTCDKNNYVNIYEVFGFESSIIEVKNFIDGK